MLIGTFLNPQERRAIRGLAACRRNNGDRRGAVDELKKVLEISKETGDYTGDADALGTIADLLTELGDLEEAGMYYDRYIKSLATEVSSDIED